MFSGNKSNLFQPNYALAYYNLPGHASSCHHPPLCPAPAPAGGAVIHNELNREKSTAQSSELGELGETGDEVPGGRARAREEVPHPQLGQAGHHSAWQPAGCLQVNSISTKKKTSNFT